MVEREMRVTLACRLKDAVGDVKQFKDGNVDPQKFIDWCDKYQVRYCNIIWKNLFFNSGQRRKFKVHKEKQIEIRF